MRHELDGLIDRKELDEALRWAREEDDNEEQLNRELAQEKKREREGLLFPAPQPRGRRRAFTPATDEVCYRAVEWVMRKAECSLSCACFRLADPIGRSAKGIARAYKRAYRRNASR
jgi:hypothetical protein